MSALVLEMQDAPAAKGRGYMPKGERQDHNTPPEILDMARYVFGGPINLDPCSNPTSVVGAEREVWFQYNDVEPPPGRNVFRGSGLVIPWDGDVFANPPFDHFSKWARKARGEYEMQRCRQVLLLGPAAVSSKWWHAHVPSAAAHQLWKGRIRFVGAKSGCPFNPAFIYWGPFHQRFREAFGAKGMVVRL